MVSPPAGFEFHRVGEVVVRRSLHRRRRVPFRLADDHRDGGRGARCVPATGGEVEPESPLGTSGEAQGYPLLFVRADLPDDDGGAVSRERAFKPVLAMDPAVRGFIGHPVAGVRARLGTAVDSQVRAGRHVLVGGQGDLDVERFVRCDFDAVVVDGDLERRHRLAADHVPRQSRAGRRAVDPVREYLETVHARRRIGDDDPFDVVEARLGLVLAAGADCLAGSMTIHPEVEVVQHGIGDRVCRGLVQS